MKARRTEPTSLVFKAQIEKSALPTKTPLSYLPKLMSQQTTIIGLGSKKMCEYYLFIYLFNIFMYIDSRREGPEFFFLLSFFIKYK
jgi:hypothetical protein